MSNCNTCPAIPVKPTGCCGCDDCKPFSTKYYHLPLWKADDVTSWLVGINNAMVSIDQLFHDFALRTGIEGVPDDVVETVQKLQASVDCLEEFRHDTVRDLASTTKVVSDMLGNLDLINEKLRALSFDQSNTVTRVKGIEQEIVLIKSNISDLFESAAAADAGIAENTQKFADLQEQLATEFTRLNDSLDRQQTVIDELIARIEELEKPAEEGDE